MSDDHLKGSELVCYVILNVSHDYSSDTINSHLCYFSSQIVVFLLKTSSKFS